MSSPEAVARAISAAKAEALTPESYQPDRYDPMGQKMLQVYPAYARRLLAANAVDFDDLLMHVVTILREDPELRARLDETDICQLKGVWPGPPPRRARPRECPPCASR